MDAKKDIDYLSSSQVDELIGICEGITSDGIINTDEAKFLFKW
jgi:hypothetical protein